VFYNELFTYHVTTAVCLFILNVFNSVTTCSSRHQVSEWFARSVQCTGLADGQDFMTAVRHTLAVYNKRHAGDPHVVISGPYASDESASIVSGRAGEQLSCEDVRSVPTTADVGAA